MENRFYKFLIVICLSLSINNGFGQGNPGFLGKKIAIGYSKQYCLLNSLYLLEPPTNESMMNVLTNNDFYVEYATSKYKSISAHFNYQKVPLAYAGLLDEQSQVSSTYIYQGERKEITYKKTGYSDFRYLNAGLKFNFYTANKTISAPVGFCYYVRMDWHSIKAINNTYTYENIGYELDPLEKASSQSQIDRSTAGTNSMNFSLGLGGESKLILSRSVFLRLNTECNLSTIGITQLVQQDVNYSTYNVKDDMRYTGQGLNRFRNMFLFGLGVGVLL